jgi:hypothetical protein
VFNCWQAPIESASFHSLQFGSLRVLGWQQLDLSDACSLSGWKAPVLNHRDCGAVAFFEDPGKLEVSF